MGSKLGRMGNRVMGSSPAEREGSVKLGIVMIHGPASQLCTVVKSCFP